jgi:hypothetical protein
MINQNLHSLTLIKPETQDNYDSRSMEINQPLNDDPQIKRLQCHLHSVVAHPR